MTSGALGASPSLIEIAAPLPAPAPPDFTVTGRGRPGEAAAAVFRRVADELAARAAEVLGIMIYCTPGARGGLACALRDALGGPQWPVTWIEGGNGAGGPLAGLQVFAVSGRPVARVRLGREVVGSVYEDGGARHCLLGGLEPTGLSRPRPEQAREMFLRFEAALAEAGFALRDVIRTWFYNDDILGWYEAFNQVRSEYYAPVAWRTGSLPASTGIGVRRANGAAATLAAWAMQPLGGDAGAAEVASPLQCPAPAYGSAFSRAMEVVAGRHRRLLVSGTASIHPDGRTAWAGDIRRQIDLTMEVIAAILQARAMGFGDVTRATAYCADPQAGRLFDAWLAARELQAMPVVEVPSDICRGDLLFELELDARAVARP